MPDSYGHSDLKDWCDFCEGRMSFDEEKKLNIRLLFPLKSENEYSRFFSYFPQASELCERFKNLYSNENGKIDDVVKLLKEEISNMRQVCETEMSSKLSGLLFEPKIVIKNLSKEEYWEVRASESHREFEDCITEYTYKFRLKQKPGFSDIFPLFLHLCGNDYRLAYSLSSPLLDNGELFGLYQDIRGKSHDYFVTPEHILLTPFPQAD